MIAALILSAGTSSRMGSAKALLKLPSGETFVRSICATARAADCSPTVVLGPLHADAIRPTLDAPSVFNPAPERGMLSSVQVGIASLSPSVEAALIWPVDIPLVRAETVSHLLAAERPLLADAARAAAQAQIVIPLHAGRGGHPMVIPSRYFAELLALDSSRGLRALFDAHPPLRIEVEDAGVLTDFDSPADLSRL